MTTKIDHSEAAFETHIVAEMTSEAGRSRAIPQPTSRARTYRRSSRPRPPSMSKLLSQKSAAKLLVEHGWTEGAGGKHNVKMTKPDHRPITLPKHKGQDYSKGLTRAILRQAGIDPKDL